MIFNKDCIYKDLIFSIAGVIFMVSSIYYILFNYELNLGFCILAIEYHQMCSNKT